MRRRDGDERGRAPRRRPAGHLKHLDAGGIDSEVDHLFEVPANGVAPLFARHIRRVYRQGWFMSLFKFAFGGFIYLFVLVFGVAATAFVTLALGS